VIYLPRLVRSIRDDADSETVTDAVESLGGTVGRRRQFDDPTVSVPQQRVAVSGTARSRRPPTAESRN
jgi:hypothetical protein